MVLSERIRKLILKQTSASAIREAAVAEGMRTLREDGIAKVRQGITTLSEVLRVTQDE
jgi:type II secretory ATPase GspE/PulE/Tfp pilus assembly ATPase PilB-like protein